MKIERLKGSMVYLLGPMEFTDDNGANWRLDASKFLKNLGIGVLNPVDKPCIHGKEDEKTKIRLNELKFLANTALLNNQKNTAEIYLNEIHDIMKEVVNIDLRLCDKADFGLMYVNKDIYTCGTWVEYAHLNLQRKPIISFTNNSILDMPLWTFGQTNFKLMNVSLDSSLSYIKSIHENEEIDRLNRWKFFDNCKIFL